MQAYKLTARQRQERSVKARKAKPLSDVEQELVIKHLRLAYFFGGNKVWKPFRMSQDEWLAECLWVLVKCCRAFDQSMGFKFSTYYSRAVFSHRVACIQKDTNFRQYVWDGDPDCTPFDDAEAQGCDPTTSMDDEGNRALLERFRANIPIQYRDGFSYWLRRFNGESASDIARSVGVSRQAVCQRCERAMRAMRVYARRERLVLE